MTGYNHKEQDICKALQVTRDAFNNEADAFKDMYEKANVRTRSEDVELFLNYLGLEHTSDNKIKISHIITMMRAKVMSRYAMNDINNTLDKVLDALIDDLKKSKSQ